MEGDNLDDMLRQLELKESQQKGKQEGAPRTSNTPKDGGKIDGQVLCPPNLSFAQIIIQCNL